MAKPKHSRWLVIARKISQGIALTSFLGIFIYTRRDGLTGDLSSAWMHLDPLAMLAQALSNKAFLGGSTLSILILLLTLTVGRAWCGWLCPLGTLLDIFTSRHQQKKKVDLNRSWQRVKYILLVVILIAALLGNLTLLVLDPLTLLYRSLAVSLFPGIDRLVLALEKALYGIPALSNLVGRFDLWLRPAVLPSYSITTRAPLVYAIIFAGVLALNLITPRFWCRVLCPLGALLGWISKISLFRRKIIPGCIECNRCARACPTGAVLPEEKYASRISECTMCMDCFAECPVEVTQMKPVFHPEGWSVFDPSRREVLATIGLTVAAGAVIEADWRGSHPHPFLIQPPGAVNDDLLAKCVRCGLCLRVCPTGILQPSILEAGLAGLWTPVLIPENGYCDYSCNACGQACPTGAIPKLNLEEKRLQVMGKAYINQERCLAWSGDSDCIVCEEMCPLPEKAITIETRELLTNMAGETKVQKLPVVDRQKCVGCGICEYKCPITGEAAIRVYTSGQGET